MILYGGGAAKDGGEEGTVLKKGPWTAAEDETLTAYVREHGEGNWNSVKKKTWLARCGKSCRLRWANHLRPNLRKGSFTPEEEGLIIQLHSQLGNKWARMAAQLPGRTDNEIKNYWNTRLKRFQRQGLPLYPPHIFPNNHHPAFQTPLFNLPSLPPKRSYNHLSTNSSYDYSINPIKPDLPSNQIPYSTSLGVYEVTNFTDMDYSNQTLTNTTCQLLEDVMEEAEALSSRPPKRTQLMFAPHDNNNNIFVSSSLQALKPKEKEMNTMQDEDIANLLDWGRNQAREISNEHSL